MFTKKVWKDECDNCHTFKEGCHGFGEFIYCPECARKLGYGEWKKIVNGKEEDMDTEVITRSIPKAEAPAQEEEKTFENGDKVVTIKKQEDGYRVNFFDKGTCLKSKVFASQAGAYKARKKWLN